MVKELKCIQCGKYLGEMEKGKIHKNASLVCGNCMNQFKIAKSSFDLKSSTNSYSVENLFGGLFGKR